MAKNNNLRIVLDTNVFLVSLVPHFKYYWVFDQLQKVLPNVELVNPYYNWNLISSDPDDNKFVDGAISGNADYLVTNDKHFRVLKEVEFPPLQVISLDEFEQLMKEKDV